MDMYLQALPNGERNLLSRMDRQRFCPLHRLWSYAAKHRHLAGEDCKPGKALSCNGRHWLQKQKARQCPRPFRVNVDRCYFADVTSECVMA
jgi:hypothetical protein